MHGCPGVIGISNDPMSVKVLAGVQRSARRDKRELTADQAAAARRLWTIPNPDPNPDPITPITL